MTKRVTVADIAARTGLSKGAVSYALNGRPGVSEPTRQRVLRTAAELGWQPDGPPRIPAGVVGLVLAGAADTLGIEPFFMKLISGMEAAMAPTGTGLLLQSVPDHAAEIETYRRWWAERRVDGVFLLAPGTADPRSAVLAELHLPTVELGRRGTPRCARFDDPSATAAALNHLRALGHHRIARVTGPEWTGSGSDSTSSEGAWVPGFRSAGPAGGSGSASSEGAWVAGSRSAGLAVPGWESVTAVGNGLGSAEGVRVAGSRVAANGLEWTVAVGSALDPGEGARATRGLLVADPAPTAIVYDNDVLAVAGLAAARELGIDVPGQLSIMALDDSVLCAVVDPAVTAVRRDVVAYGRLAAEQLLALLRGDEPHEVESPRPEVAARASTGRNLSEREGSR